MSVEGGWQQTARQSAKKWNKKRKRGEEEEEKSESATLSEIKSLFLNEEAVQLVKSGGRYPSSSVAHERLEIIAFENEETVKGVRFLPWQLVETNQKEVDDKCVTGGVRSEVGKN